jgi:glycerol kinase
MKKSILIIVIILFSCLRNETEIANSSKLIEFDYEVIAKHTNGVQNIYHFYSPNSDLRFIIREYKPTPWHKKRICFGTVDKLLIKDVTECVVISNSERDTITLSYSNSNNSLFPVKIYQVQRIIHH